VNAPLRLRDVIVDPDDDIYPCSDGKPVGETDYHVVALFYLRTALDGHFHDQDDVCVATDMFFYYQEGNPAANKSPDIMVVKGVPKRRRRSFKLWEENAGPCVIIELISRDSRNEDLVEKPRLYASLGVNEYFVYDPEGRSLRQPRLLGFRRNGQRFVPLKPAADGGLTSAELGLRLIPEGEIPRLVDVATGERLLTPEELIAEAKALRQELKQTRQQHQTAEPDLAKRRARRKKRPRND
jgi:Uma2 family endonuclease